MAKKDIKEYLQEVRKIYSNKDYTELTLRTPFENLITGLNDEFNLIQEPKRVVNLGAPDFNAFLGSAKIGSIETKNLGENLDKIISSEQIKKYIDSIDNLILTDYSRFILIRNGQKVIDFYLFTLMDLENSNFNIPDEKIELFKQLIDEFFYFKLPTIKDAEELARELAKKAKLLKDRVKIQLKEDLSKNTDENALLSPIYDFYLGIKSLIIDINIEDAADAYAQTVTYGLFLARKNPLNKEIDRISAYAFIPENIGIIKRMFTNMSTSEFPSNISWIIDDIVKILNVTDMNEVFSAINKRGLIDKDPIIFLYEDFLNFYEPDKKKKLGVYYTPRPVVNFIVNSINFILKKNFDKSTGLAEDTVTVLDPAAGTGTFFWITFLVVLGELVDNNLSGLIPGKIRNHLLKHFYGFEILITPYVISHLKLADLLRTWHYKLKESDRIQIYLSNTLEPSKEGQLQFLPFLREIALENIESTKIKSKQPIIAIIGNPPYAGMSANKGRWIDELLKKGYKRADNSYDDGYYTIDGEKLDEKNPKWLQDDYVKFIRFAQWKIDKNGEGVVGFITNHSFIDNPTFRGMRESLLESFDRIYILNLHGNAKKKERCPDGSKDENVFDIQQGVAISLFIKNSAFKDKKVFYSDLWGLKDYKYHWLDRHIVDNVEWEEIEPISEFYFLIPMNKSILSEFEKYWKIKDIFPINNVGIVTARDPLTIQWTADDVSCVIHDFANLEIEQARNNYKLRKDSSDWKINWAQEDLKSSGLDDDKITPILYRPFDVRYTYFTGKTKGFHCRPREDIMKHMQEDNRGLIIGRQWGAIGSSYYDIVFVSDKIIDFNLFRRGGELIFPLYLYEDTGKIPNLNPNLIKYLYNKYGVEPSPEVIFYYIYSMLQSPNYRKKYEPILRYDFPRIPFIDDYEKFKELSEIGEYLVEIHLMRKNMSVKTKFDIEGSNIVENVAFKDGKLWINKEQYFEGVPISVWNYHIGGYNVLHHFIKERKNKKLSNQEIVDFLQIIEIIKITLVSMRKIDEILFN
ncbi:MAG: DNA methyltransferase [Methanobacterium sp.]|jgi:predicted helicase|nr:MAG: DNA methyltransferase [Methanobacterium sp.]